MADSVDLGYLLLTLGVDSERYEAQLEQAKRKALSAANQIEMGFMKSMGGAKLKAPDLHLEPTVNDRALTDLNKHLSLKEQHFKQVQYLFQNSPLTVEARADFRDVDEMENRLNKLASKNYSANVSAQQQGSFGPQSYGRQDQYYRSGISEGYSVDANGRTRYAAGDPMGRGGQYAPETEALGDDLLFVKRKMDAILEEVKRGRQGGGDEILDAALNAIAERAVGAAVEEGLPAVRNILADQFDARVPRFVQKMTGTDDISDRIRGSGSGQAEGGLITDRDITKFSRTFAKEFELAGERTAKRFARAAGKGDVGGVFGSLVGAITDLPKTVLAASVTGLGEMVGSKIGNLFASEIDDVLKNTKSVVMDGLPIIKDVIESSGGKRTERQEENLTKSAETVKMMAAEMVKSGQVQKDPVGQNKRIIYATAGFASQEGKASGPLAEKIQDLIGDRAEVRPFENQNFDLKTNAKDDMAGWMKEATEKVAQVAAQGYNPDSLKLAAEIVAEKAMNPDSQIGLVGHSAGGLISQETAAILEKLGIAVETLTLGTPNVDFVPSPQESGVTRLMGTGDTFSAMGKGQKSVQAAGHESDKYLQSEDFQRELIDFSEKSFKTPMPMGIKTPEMEVATSVSSGMQEAIANAQAGAEKAEQEVGNQLETIKEEIQAAIPAESIEPKVSELSRKVKEIRQLVESANSMVTALPDKANEYMTVFAERLPEIEGEIEQLLEAMTPVERTGSKEGNQLTQLKSQVAGAKGRAEQNAIQEAVRSQALSGGSPEARIKALGQTFSAQKAFASNQNTSEADVKSVAKAISDSAEEARKAIDELVESLGEEATPQLRKIAATAKGQITVARKGVEGIDTSSALDDTPNSSINSAIASVRGVGRNVPEGAAKGIAEASESAAQAAGEMAQGIIDAAEDVLDIQSPSKVFERIGKFVGAGFSKGIGNSMAEAIAAQQEKVKQAAADFFEIERTGNPLETMKKMGSSNKAKELAGETGVAIAGTAASTVGRQLGGGGDVAAAAAEFLGTIAARQAKVIGEAAFKAIKRLDVESAGVEAGLGRFAKLMQLINEELIKSQLKNGDELTGDIAGFAGGKLGEAAASFLPPGASAAAKAVLPMASGMGAGMSAVRFRQKSVASSAAGGSLAEGLANGISSGSAGAESAAAEMADRIIEVTKEEFGINSPSKVFEQIGRFISEGLAKGINGFQGAEAAVKSSAIEVVENVQNGQYANRAAHGAGKIVGSATAKVKETNDNIESLIGQAEEYKAQAAAIVENVNASLDESQTVKNGQETVESFMGMLDEFKQKNLTVSGVLEKISKTEFGSSLKKQIDSIPIAGLVEGFVAFQFLLVPIIGFLAAFGGQFSQAAMEAENFNRIIDFSSSSGFEAAKNIDFLSSTVKNLSLDLKTARSGYSQLLAASKDTPLEGVGTEQIFAATSQATSVYGLDTEGTNASFLAMQQIMSKGKVSAEELRQQLGEKLPGAFQIAARAMGMTTSELDKVMSTGNLLSEDFMPKFAQQLASETSTGLAGAANTGQAALNRFNNSLLQVQEQLGKPILSVQKTGLDVGASVMGLVADNAGMLSQALLFFAAGGALKAFEGVAALIKVLMGVPAIATAVGTAMTALSGALMVVAKTLMTMMMQFAVFSAIVSVFQTIQSAVSDTSGKIGEAADNITKRMEKYGETLDKVSGRSERFKKSLKMATNSGAEEGLDPMKTAATGLANTLTGGMFTPVVEGVKKAFNVNPVEMFSDALGGVRGKLDSIAEGFTNIKAESLMESTIAGSALKMVLGDELGTGVSRGIERGTQGALGLRTFSQKQAEDNIVQSGNVVGGANLALSEAYTMFGADGKGNAQVKQVQGIDSRLAENSMQRQALSPEDSKGKRDLEKIRDELLKERESANAAIATLQGVIAGNLEDLKSTKADLEAKLESGMFDTPENADNKRALQAQLAAVTDAIEGSAKAQDKFNELVKQSVSLVQRLRREYVMISAKTADASANLDLSEAESRAALAQQKASGPMMTSGQSESADSNLALASLEQRLKANQEAMTRFQSILSDSAVTGALQTAGVSATAGAGETRAIAETLGEGDLQEYLNQAADAKEQVMSLQTEGARLQEQIAQSAADTRQRIQDLSKEMMSFFQEIADQSAETSRTVKDQDITSSMSNAKAQLIRAVSKFGDEYFGSLTGSLIDMVEQLFSPLQELNNLQGQMSGFQQQARAGYEQMMQFQQQMPGAAPGATSGQAAGIRQVATGTLAAQEYNAARPGGRRHAGQDLDYTVDGKAQSMIGGTVTRVGNDPGGYGRYVDVYNSALGVVERLAEMDQTLVQVGDQIAAGQDVGAGTRDTGVIHYEIRTDANAQGQGGFGKNGTVDPIDFLEQRGIMERRGNQLMPTAGGRPATTIAEEHHVGDGHDHGAVAMPAARPAARPMAAPVAAPATSLNNLTVKGRQADAEQIANARIIAETGQRLGATSADIQAAIATAIQESTLRNLTGGDRDSLGIFQQRPSMEWGSRDQISDPRFAAESFFSGRGSNIGLLDVENRSDPIAASHRVQRSANPNAPRQWMNEAGAISGALGSAPQQMGGAATAGMNDTLNAAGGQIGQNLQQLQQSAMSSYSAGLNLSDAQFEASINGATRQLQEVNRQIADQVQGIQRSQEDMRSGLEMDTPVLQLTQQLRSIGRETADRIQEQSRQNESLSNSIEQYESTIKVFEGIKQGLLSQVGQLEASGDQASLAAAQSIRGRMEGLDQLIGEAQGSIDAAKSAQAQLAEMNDSEGGIGAQRRSAEVDRFVQGRRQEMLPAQLESMRRSGRGEEANNLEYQSQADELTRAYEASIRTLDSEQAIAEVRGESVEYLEQIRALTEEEYGINMSNLQAVRDRATAEAARAYGNESFQGDMAIGQARLEQGRALGGDTFGMRNAERDMAIAEQNNGLVNQLAEIQMAGEAAGRSAEQIQHLKDQATQLNDIRIDNLTTQFSEVPELLAPVQAGFEGFFTDIFSGTKSVGEAFQGMVSSILSSIASLVAKKLVMGIFGSLLGGGMGGGGGILSGLFGMNKGGVVPGLASGGEVPMVNMSAMRQGNDPIGMALRKEGSNSVLAALTPGEVVLTTKQAQSYFDLGMDKVLNFKTGGTVPGGGRSGGSPRVDLSGVSGNTTNVSVPISINSQGGDDQSKEKDRDLARKLKDPVESLVMQILQREKRYSGELYR